MAKISFSGGHGQRFIRLYGQFAICMDSRSLSASSLGNRICEKVVLKVFDQRLLQAEKLSCDSKYPLPEL